MSRIIRQTAGRSSTEVSSLLQSILAAEYLLPSKTIWLISPWISDVEIIDNRTSDFDAIGAWGPRKVRLSEVLAGLAAKGTTVVLATTSADANSEFLENIVRSTSQADLSDALIIHRDDEMLHEKALTTDTSFIFGSMNFTYNGIFIRSELIEFTTDPERVNEARLDNHHRFGGVL